MIAIVIPIESEGSSFFNRRYAMFPSVGVAFDKKITKYWNEFDEIKMQE